MSKCLWVRKELLLVSSVEIYRSYKYVEVIKIDIGKAYLLGEPCHRKGVIRR